MNVTALDPIIPTRRSLEKKRDIYQWSDPKDRYPPHLATLPENQSSGEQSRAKIFDQPSLMFVGAIAQSFKFLIPGQISHEGTPYQGPTIADCVKYNIENPSPNTSIMNGKNIGFKEDWYSDARFAQQYLSGVDPCSITQAPASRVQEFITEASKQGLDGMKKLLQEGKDLLIQDYSWFRKAAGLTDLQSFQNIVPEMSGTQQTGLKPTGLMATRYACAPIVLLQLHDDGLIHPLAITLDYRGSLNNSVTIFNRRLTPKEKGDIDEKDDWPWRYAKTCAATADWARHEIATHLVDTHMIEEAIIVATNRTIPEDHLLYELLSPHWFRTLSLNSAAREVLVPAVIARIGGFGPTPDPHTNLAYNLVDFAYKNFNFQDKYIPNDLKKRGFDIEANIGEKYRNYPYATNMYLLWGVIRDFVQTVLGAKYKSDQDVKNDKYIADWCEEIHTKGQIATFPTITTRDQLFDAVTMCIHIASPQHTAVNYLQDYYYAFVAARPPAMCTPLPQDLKTLQGYKEKDLTSALPIGDDGPKWKDWLLAAQLPKLLSFKVDSRYNLVTYAKSLYNVNKDRTMSEKKEFPYSEDIKKAAELFYNHLKVLKTVFEETSKNQTEGTIEYNVLQPEFTAVSILI